MAAGEQVIEINGKRYPLPDMKRITFGEAEDIAELTKRPFDEFDELDDTTKVFGYVFLTLKRENPATTPDDARAVAIFDVKVIGPEAVAPGPEDDAVIPPAGPEPLSVLAGSDESSTEDATSGSVTTLATHGARS